MSKRADSVVQVRSPARLHTGFFDPSGRLGRRFDSIGLALDGPATTVTVAPAPRCSVQDPQAEPAQRYTGEMADWISLTGGAAIQIVQSIPGHVGLGSGTRLAAHSAQDYAAADRIRSELAALGIIVEHHADCSAWRRAG